MTGATTAVYNAAMAKLEETVTIRRDVPSNIADLVYFARYLVKFDRDVKTMTDDELIAAARRFWDQQHGEDD